MMDTINASMVTAPATSNMSAGTVAGQLSALDKNKAPLTNPDIISTTSGGTSVTATTAGDALRLQNTANDVTLGLAIQSQTGYSARIKGKADGINTALAIETGNTERLRITEAGNVGISSTAPAYTLTVGGIAAPAATNAYSLGASGCVWSNIYLQNAPTVLSDERYKTAIADSELGLEFINALRPVSYKFKTGENEILCNNEGNKSIVAHPGKRTHYGLIAQEVKAVLADTDFGGWVKADTENRDSEEGLRYEEFIAPLIKAVQELNKKVDLQANRIAELEGKQ